MKVGKLKEGGVLYCNLVAPPPARLCVLFGFLPVAYMEHHTHKVLRKCLQNKLRSRTCLAYPRLMLSPLHRHSLKA